MGQELWNIYNGCKEKTEKQDQNCLLGYQHNRILSIVYPTSQFETDHKYCGFADIQKLRYKYTPLDYILHLWFKAVLPFGHNY